MLQIRKLQAWVGKKCFEKRVGKKYALVTILFIVSATWLAMWNIIYLWNIYCLIGRKPFLFTKFFFLAKVADQNRNTCRIFYWQNLSWRGSLRTPHTWTVNLKHLPHSFLNIFFPILIFSYLLLNGCMFYKKKNILLDTLNFW